MAKQLTAPAEGILQMKKFEGWRQYKVVCECGCDSDIDISLEIDRQDDQSITCHISSKVSTAWWRKPIPVTYNEKWLLFNLKIFVNRWINTFLICWTAIRHGYVELESYTLLSQQQALNMSAALQSGIDDLESEKRDQK
jgi:hypothetical protein